MKLWHIAFDFDEEFPSLMPIWVHLPRLPLEYWNDDSFMVIGNSLGTYMGVSEKTQELSLMAYARICAHLPLDRPLPT